MPKKKEEKKKKVQRIDENPRRMRKRRI